MAPARNRRRGGSKRLVLLGTLLGSALAATVTPPRVITFSDPGTRDGYVRGAAAASEVVNFTISLRQQNIRELKARALAASTPGSAEYGRYMRQAEIDALTAPKPEHLHAVASWLRAAGVQFSTARELVAVSTTVAAAEALLGTTFVSYSQPGRHAPLLRATTYSLPRAVADATACTFGLHGMPLPLGRGGPLRLRGHHGDVLPPESVVKVTPTVLAATYNFSGAFVDRSSANRQAVAEFQAQYMDKKDLSAFFKAEVPKAQPGDDEVSKFVNSKYVRGTGDEADLDVQFIMGVAPGVATEFWEWPADDFCADLHSWTDAILTGDDVPITHSVSYGWQGEMSELQCKDEDIQTTDLNFAKLAAKGISILISSGDDGSACTNSPCALSNRRAGVAITEGDVGSRSDADIDECCFHAEGWDGWMWSAPTRAPPAKARRLRRVDVVAEAPIVFKHEVFHVGAPGVRPSFAAGDVWYVDGSVPATGGSVLVHSPNGTLGPNGTTMTFSGPVGGGSSSRNGHVEYNLSIAIGSQAFHGRAACLAGIDCGEFIWHLNETASAILFEGPNPTPLPSRGSCTVYRSVNKTAAAPNTTVSGGSKVAPVKAKLYPSWPASSPWVTAVGATRFVDQKVGGGEMATDQFGSGGGFSGLFNQTDAPWQVDAVAAYVSKGPSLPRFPPAGQFPPHGRATPDVSGLGEGFQVFVAGEVHSVGGTSASAPMFAGLVSLLNEARLKAGKPRMGFLNPFLYANAHAFFDVTQGTNAIPRSGKGHLAYGYAAAPGWDAATGLGTPHFGKLLAAALADPPHASA